MFRLSLLICMFALTGCKAGAGDKCGKPSDCKTGLQCGKNWKCFDPAASSGAQQRPVGTTSKNAATATQTGEVSQEANRRKTSEATWNLRKLFDSSVSYFNEEQADRTGSILPRQFPVSATAPSHADWYAQVCKNGRSNRYQPEMDTWDAASWQALNFAIDDPFYYKYTYISNGTGAGAKFTVRAIGDLDCDGVFSTFERIGTIDAENNIRGGAGVFTNQPLE
jgi:hypothetical protein